MDDCSCINSTLIDTLYKLIVVPSPQPDQDLHVCPNQAFLRLFETMTQYRDP